jgi:hypothetical protein
MVISIKLGCASNAPSRARAGRERASSELNAARDLARVAAEGGNVAEALATLRTIADWFPASLDVPILAECRALLQ